ncbi:group II intron reverse transcriptase/maturase [Enterobacter bugandensis]|uniref:group II intron reverse transcriptase/maturase n=1 Tax=Enterobacter bugandensis TaxID=881260 RepID=UPI0010A3E607|nr:group II intron reverse transcriptase/maturase [Enterobacter bugandensis]THE53810.1 group II intron reverse transcriptase/maturase [Enterobacter bugandensis]THE57085.1 group II intron reverse transcriptase/maturase [Enterobacter bugandensis]
MMAKAGAASGIGHQWDALEWHSIEANVSRLQARIVKAVQENRWNKVRVLSYLLTRSMSGKFLAARRVTSNKGRSTPGVDGIIWDSSAKRFAGAQSLKSRGYSPSPLRRIYIPKANGKQRPLGIPTMKDRAMQALFLLALDPIAETTADGGSYGFRGMRRCADAIERCFANLSRKTSPEWVLEGDIKGCFDNIDHQWLIDHVPMNRTVLRKWLKSGFMEKQVYHSTTAGTPQGGIISPALANLALDGLESVLRKQFPLKGKGQGAGKAAKVHLIRYADDFIITGNSREIITDIIPLVEAFLAERGLELSKEKTRVTHVSEGFDFLGQNIRRYPNGKLLIKPSKKSISTLIAKLKAIVKRMIAQPAASLIARLNPAIRGWANYHRHVVSKQVFTYVDHLIFEIIWRWAKSRHPHKGLRWIKKKYFTQVRSRDWIFSGLYRDTDTGKVTILRLVHAQSVKIVRHRLVASALNPYDTDWTDYIRSRTTHLTSPAASFHSGV